MYLHCELITKRVKEITIDDFIRLDNIEYRHDTFIHRPYSSTGGTNYYNDDGCIYNLVDTSDDKLFYLFQIDLDKYKFGEDDVVDWILVNIRKYKLKKILNGINV